MAGATRTHLFPALAAVLLLAGTGPAAGQSVPQYQPWQPQGGGVSPSLVEELRAIVAQARRDQAASPDLLSDLEALVRRYGATGDATPSAPPPAATTPPAVTPPAAGGGRTVFTDDFADGNYTAAPAWTVLQGDWRVDGGTLRSDARAASGGQGGVAAIALQQRLGNAFTIGFDLVDAATAGQFELRVYQGSARDYGYRLVYRADGRPHFAIYRSGRSGIVQLASSTAPQPLPGGTARIGWLRSATGEMRITINGTTVVTTTDTSFRDPWDGVMLVNFGGDFGVPSISASE